ncbi:MAG: Gfo/Idh/MocA family oxidoreductase [Negativibacillus sp.]
MIRFATVGTGWIVGEFLRGAKEVPEVEYAACYSRSRDRGELFAREWGAQKVYTDLEQMAQDDAIDAVYIASPNSLHYEQSKLFLQNGKHVICEKPITVEPEQLEELQQLAQQKQLIYLEALIGVYLPQMQVLKGAVERLGRVHLARFDFSQYSSKYPAYLRGEVPNIFNPKMATGGLMDLGIYCLYPAIILFGVPDKVDAHARFLDTGADASGCVTLQYADKTVVLTYSKTAQGVIGSEIQGEDGVIRIPRISKLVDMTFTPLNGEERLLTGPEEKYRQMSYEVAFFKRFIEEPTRYRPYYQYVSNLSLNVSRVMKQVREKAGIFFE